MRRGPPPGFRAAGGLAAAAIALGGCSVERDATALYAALTEAARAEGAMRTEAAPRDAPFGNAAFLRNFDAIVFHTEFTLRDSVLVPEARETALMRWVRPVRYRLIGDAVEPGDQAIYRALAAELAEATGHDIAEAGPDEPDNLLVMILGRQARRDAAATLMRAGAPNAGLIHRLRADDYAIPCAASVNVNPATGEIVQALVLVKGETTGLLREACAHEEFAQALGPGNDSDEARPSIFNDDGEFALLTDHDRLLLRVLYDPRLKPGMSRSAAAPLVAAILDELRPEGGESGMAPAGSWSNGAGDGAARRRMASYP